MLPQKPPSVAVSASLHAYATDLVLKCHANTKQGWSIFLQQSCEAHHVTDILNGDCQVAQLLPATQNLATREAELEAAQHEASELTQQLASLNHVQSDNSDLKAQLQGAELQMTQLTAQLNESQALHQQGYQVGKQLASIDMSKSACALKKDGLLCSAHCSKR